jgi:hypothetical protein
MSKRIHQAGWTIVVVALLMIVGFSQGSPASADPGASKVASAEVQTADQPAEAYADEVVPEATCAAIKCPPGKICINVLQCTPSGDCFHVGRCVSPP